MYDVIIDAILNGPPKNNININKHMNLVTGGQQFYSEILALLIY